MTPQEMTRLLRESIPLCDFMQYEVSSLDEQTITAGAPFEPNRNVHNTGFAGSLYSLCVASGWALVYNRLISSGANGSLVVKEARIRYRKPVTGSIECRGSFDEAFDFPLKEVLEEKGRVYLKVTVEFLSQGELCGSLFGNYVIVSS